VIEGSSNTAAHGIVAVLASAGVREVFSIVGGALTPLIGAFAGQDTIRYVGVRHEFAAATMAAAMCHGTGRLAVCLGEQGPGTLNLVSGLGVAFNNNLPVIAITVSGHSVTSQPGSGALMELDAILLTRAVTKWQRAVRHPDDAAPAVAEAIRQARSGRPGPVHVDIPRDLIGAVAADFDLPVWAGVGEFVLHGSEIADAVAALSHAERPLVIAGGGANGPGVAEILRQLSDHLDAVTTTTQMGIGVLPSDGPLFAGQGGVIGGPALIRAASEADVVLAVGCRFSSWWWREGQRLTKNARLVQVDVDPAAVAASGPGTVGLVGDAHAVLTRLWAELAKTAGLPLTPWATSVHEDLLAHRRRLAALAEQTDPPAHPAALASQLAARLHPDDLVVLDGGHTTFWSNDFVPALQPRTVFHEPGMGHLGFGVPYANALAIAHPERRVVTITGDGAFGFSLVELDTARRLGLRTITVIADNALWGVISLAQRRGGFSLGTDLSGTDYAAIANGFGCVGIRVDDIADFPAAYEKALASELPVVIDAVVRFEPHPNMPDFGRTTATPS
jgi:thiamine pyrophosphate-dependent acetolactate synthase large subunit-like protein